MFGTKRSRIHSATKPWQIWHSRQVRCSALHHELHYLRRSMRAVRVYHVSSHAVVSYLNAVPAQKCRIKRKLKGVETHPILLQMKRIRHHLVHGIGGECNECEGIRPTRHHGAIRCISVDPIADVVLARAGEVVTYDDRINRGMEMKFICVIFE